MEPIVFYLRDLVEERLHHSPNIGASLATLTEDIIDPNDKAQTSRANQVESGETQPNKAVTADSTDRTRVTHMSINDTQIRGQT